MSELTQNIDGFLEVIGNTQTSSIAEMHQILAVSMLEPSTRSEEETLCFLESLFDSNQLHGLIDIVKSGPPLSFDLNMDTLSVTYKQLMVRNQYQVPSSMRLKVLSEQMEESLWQWQREVEEGATGGKQRQSQSQSQSQDVYHQLLPPLDTIWRKSVDNLIDTIKINSTLFQDFQVLRYEPQVFLWSIYRDTYSAKSPAFRGIQASPLYQSLWMRGLEKSKHYMHFRTRGMLSNPMREFPPFRNERYGVV